MYRTVIKGLVLGALLIPVLPREGLAWSRDGHRIICRIAWQLLDQAQRNEIDRLTSAYRNPDLQPVGPYWDACSYADVARTRARRDAAWARFAMFEPWHYAAVPRNTTKLPTPPCRVSCVISAVNIHANLLRRERDDRSRAEALFFLSHWVGDLHQPLHVNFEDDRGGNSVRLVEGGYYNASNLHALWDAGILDKAIFGANRMDVADQLARDITPAHRAEWILGTSADWAQESYDLITSPAAQYCDWQVTGGARTCAPRFGSRTLGEEYQREFADDVILRLQQAGVRLAELLRENLVVP